MGLMRFLTILGLAACVLTSGCGAESLSAETGTAQAVENTGTGSASGSDEIAGGVKDAAITGASGNIAVDAGFAGDGAIIHIPAGFTSAQCKFTASPSIIDGNAISTEASINRDTGEIICEKVVQERVEIPPEIQACTASYTIICVK
jgi:hypothetical protein